MSSVPVSVIDQVSASLSLSGLRNEAIASNIANRDTEGYQRMEVRFHQALGAETGPALVPERATQTTSLEQDLVALSSNGLRYETLARALSRYFVLLGTITNSNRS